jgi:hypothetical protein
VWKGIGKYELADSFAVSGVADDRVEMEPVGLVEEHHEGILTEEEIEGVFSDRMVDVEDGRVVKWEDGREPAD